MKRITESDPQIIVCDYHPTYYSTKAAQELPTQKIIKVQHHTRTLSAAWRIIKLKARLTVYGRNRLRLGRQRLGGEFLIADETGFERFGHLQYTILPGGEKAIHERWPHAASLLKSACGSFWIEMA